MGCKLGGGSVLGGDRPAQGKGGRKDRWRRNDIYRDEVVVVVVEMGCGFGGCVRRRLDTRGYDYESSSPPTSLRSPLSQPTPSPRASHVSHNTPPLPKSPRPPRGRQLILPLALPLPPTHPSIIRAFRPSPACPSVRPLSKTPPVGEPHPN